MSEVRAQFTFQMNMIPRSVSFSVAQITTFQITNGILCLLNTYILKHMRVDNSLKLFRFRACIYKPWPLQ